MSVTLDWIRIQGWDLICVCSMSEAMSIQGKASGCLSVWFWDVYEWKGTFQSTLVLYFIALYTNWGSWGD